MKSFYAILQLLSQVVQACGEEEEGGAEELSDGYHPEGGGVAEVFADEATGEYTQSDADVPGDEQGGVGRATFVVVRHGDYHVLEGGP